MGNVKLDSTMSYVKFSQYKVECGSLKTANFASVSHSTWIREMLHATSYRVRRDFVCDLMSCVNILIGNSLYDAIWLLASTRSYADSLVT